MGKEAEDVHQGDGGCVRQLLDFCGLEGTCSDQDKVDVACVGLHLTSRSMLAGNDDNDSKELAIQAL